MSARDGAATHLRDMGNLNMDMNAPSRRRFLTTLSSAGALGVVGAAEAPAQEAPPETTRIRLIRTATICWAPQYIAEQMLRAEGFSEVSYAEMPGGAVSARLASGDADMTMHFVGPNIIRVEAGDPVVFLAGVHIGCFEVLGGERVKRISDLKGKIAAINAFNGADHVFFASIAANVGLDPRKDINWEVQPPDESIRRFSEGKVDAIIAFPPLAQELRAKGVGRVIINSSTDRPWSQYYCCLATANREFVRKHPIAAKRALRAILKAADICATDPAAAAQRMVDLGFTTRSDYARQTVQEVPYNKWREYHPEDSIRFYALRLREAGMIKSSPAKIIADSTDWRFLDELKRELKG
jgi:NitT/TauT family transport system substrate-binding protein